AAAARPVSPRVTTRFSIRDVCPFVRRGRRGLVDAGYSACPRKRFGHPLRVLSSPPHERGPSGNVDHRVGHRPCGRRRLRGERARGHPRRMVGGPRRRAPVRHGLRAGLRRVALRNDPGTAAPGYSPAEMVRRLPESWIVWAIVGAVVVFDAGAVVLGILDRQVQSLAATVMFSPTTVGFAVVGALIVSKHRAHSIGWLFVAVAFFFSLCHNLAQNYAVYALVVDSGSLPAGTAVFWFASSALDTIYVGAMLLLLLLFPDGKPLTPRWRPLVWAALVASALGVLRGGLEFDAQPPLQGVHNPIAVSGAWVTAINALQAVTVPLTIAALLGGVASMVLRFRRSEGTERQQMKWVVAGVVIWLVVFAGSLVGAVAGFEDANAIPFVVSIALFPAVMGLAILRYRLYDVDLVIRRTLVYSCLVAILGAVYLAGITLLGSLSLSVT